MLQPRPAHRLLLAMAAVLALAGCAGGLGGARRPDLGAALLTMADVQALPNAPGGLIDRPDQVVELTLAAKFAPQAQPGVCGKPPVITLPPPGDRAASVFVSEPGVLLVTQWVYRLDRRMAELYFSEQYAMLRSDCPPTWMEGPNGPQAEEVLGEVRLPPIGDDRVARSSHFWLGNTKAYAMTASIRSGGMLTTISVASLREVSPQFLTDLAVTAAQKLG